VKPRSGERAESLVCGEREAVFINTEGSLGDRLEDTSFEVISEVPAIEFAYLSERSDQMMLEWENTWDLETNNLYPRAVKLTVTEKPETNPIVLIVPLGSAGFDRKANESLGQN
jgi:hypothetical protein